MHKSRALVAGFAAAGAIFAMGFVGTPAANADTGSCASYLEQNGSDTSVRYQVCAVTEVLADAVSQAYALKLCTPAMTATALPEDQTLVACHLAVSPK